MSHPPRLLFTAQEAADMLGVAKSTVHARVAAGEWPYTRILSRGIRFTQAQIDRILAGAAVEPAPQRPPRRRRRKA